MSFMASGASLLALATVASGVAGADAQRSAGNKAADAASRGDAAALAQQQAQFEAIQKLLAPFVTGGTAAFGAQGDLTGINGADKQKAAIAAIQASPQFGALTKQGEDAILSNASATGGLRGGNTQAALGQFRPALLSQLIDQQYSRLGGLASVGENAAAMTGNAGMHSTDMISRLLEDQGAVQAGKYLSQGQAQSNLFGSIGKGIGMYFGAGGGF